MNATEIEKVARPEVEVLLEQCEEWKESPLRLTPNEGEEILFQLEQALKYILSLEHFEL